MRFALNLGLYCTRKLIWIAVAVVIVLGIVVAAARLGLPPLAERWKPQIQQMLSAHFQRPVQIGNLDLAWRDHGLALSISDFGLGNQHPQDGDLRLDRAFVRLDTWSSVREGRAVFDGLLLERLRLDLDLDGDTALAIGIPGGMLQEARGGERSGAPINIRSLDLVDAEIVVRSARLGDEPQRFSDLDLSLRRDGELIRFGVNARLPVTLGDRLRVVGEIGRGPEQASPWRGQLYAEGENLNLAALQRFDPKFAGIDGSGRLKLWAELGAGQLQRVDAEVAVSGLEAGVGPAKLGLDAIEARLLWEADERGWRLSGDWLRLWQAGRESPVPGFTVRVTRAADGSLSAVEGEVTSVSVATVRRFVRALPDAPAAFVAYVETGRPRGDIRDLNFRWQPGAQGEAAPLRLRAQLDGFGIDPVASYPGIEGLSGTLVVDGERAWFDALSEDLEFNAPKLYRQPLAVDDLRGRVQVARIDGEWRLRSRRLEVVSANFTTVSRLRLQLRPGERSPFLDLQTAFYRLDGSRHGEFLPLRALRPRLADWLAQAIVSADIPAGATVFRGPLHGFPFRNHEGTFLTTFAVQDAILEFHPRWPRAEELDVDVEFRGSRFSAAAESARLMDLHTDSVEVEIPDLGDPVVHLRTGGDSALPALLEFLEATPLTERVVSRLGPLVFAGAADVAVNLKLPLKTPAPELVGMVEFDGSRISVPPWKLELEAVSGPVAFTQDSVLSEGLTAMLDGEPLELTLSTVPATAGQGSTTVVDARGGIAAAPALQKHFPWLAPHVEGRSDWQARVSLGPEAGRVAVRLKSQLAGTAVNLPAPLGKEAAAGLPTVIAIHTADRSGVLGLRVDYGLNTRFLGTLSPANRARPVERGVLHFGAGDPELPAGEGVRVAGIIEELALGEWLARFPPGEAAGFPAWLHSVDLGLGLARYGELRFQELAVQAEPGAWRLMSSDPRFQGVARGGFPIRSEPVEIRLTTLSHEPGAINGSSREWIDPRSLPPLRFQADSLVIRGVSVGSLAFDSKRTADGLTIPALRSESDNHTLEALLTWERKSGGDRTTVKVKLDAKDTGEALRNFGVYSDVDGAEGVIEFAGEWQAPLPAPDLESVAGTFSADLGPGHLIEVRPGAGKLMGLFNLYDVGRRLQLDFRDLNAEGFVFDSISARGRIEAGNVYDDGVAIVGPAARVEISGRVGLIDRDYDQRIVVTPEVSSTLPVAGLIAGGPAVGAALLIAGKVFEDDINRVAQVEYALTGSWDEPVFEKIEIDGLDMNDPSHKGGDQ